VVGAGLRGDGGGGPLGIPLAAIIFALTYDGSERIFWVNGVALAGLFVLE
jgi:hypothetical protein